ncbi:MAG TPA: hypothetical protein VMO17_11275 [Terriglobia bacterium]|nr:hypothetical protein [Terriglobia bacterium]
MEERNHASVLVAQSPDGTCKRTVTIVEYGSPLRLAAKPGRKLFTDRQANLCTAKFPGAVASRVLYLQLRPDGQFCFSGNIEDATLFTSASHVISRVIPMVQINCEHCAAIEIGNDQRTTRVELPQRTDFQSASLKAKAKADRTGRLVPITVPKPG